MEIVSSDVHPRNVPEENEVNEHSESSGKITSFKFVQSSKSKCPVSVQNLEYLTDSKDVHPSRPWEDIVLRSSVISRL